MAVYTWDASGAAPLDDGAGSWAAAGGTNWEIGAVYGAWGNTTADEAVFGVGSGAAGTITVGTVTANALTFNAPGSGSYDLSGGTITLGGTTPTVDVAADVTIGSVIAGASLTKSSSGTLTLSGANTYSGGTIHDTGTIVLANDDALGTGAVTVLGGTFESDNASRSVGNDISIGSGGMNFDGTIDLEFSGTITTDEYRVIRNHSANSTLTFSGPVTVTDKVQFRFGDEAADDGTTVVSGVISGTNEVTMGGGSSTTGGTLILSGTNTYTGATIVSKGTLALSGGSAVGDSSAVTVAGGATLDINGSSETVGSLAGAGTVINNGPSNKTLTVGGDNSSTNFSGTLESGTSTLNLKKVGTGTLTLSADNFQKYGSTTIDAGTLKLGIDDALSKGVTVNAAGILDLNGFDTNVGALNSAGIVQATTGTSQLKVGSGTFSGTIDDAGGVLSLWAYGSHTLTGDNTFSGSLTVKSGTVRVGDGTTGSLGAGNYTGGVVIYPGQSLIFNQSTAQTLSGVISDAGTLTKQGTGTLTLTGTNTYTGGTTLSGGTLLSSDDGLGDGAVTVTADATLGGSSDDRTLSNDIAINSGVTLTALSDGSGDQLILSGDLSGSGTLQTTDTSAGYRVVLSGDNSSFAGTVIQRMTGGDNLQFRGVSSAIPSGTFVINDGDVELNGVGTYSFGSLSGAGGRLLTYPATGAHTISVGGLNTSTTYSGEIGDLTGTLALTKVGTGALILAGTNTYTGETTISAGTLQIGDGSTGSLGSGNYAGDISNEGTVVFNQSSDQTLSGTLSGIGALEKQGTGVLTLSGTNTYTGGTTISAGTITAGSTSALGTGDLDLTVSGATLDINDFNSTVDSIAGVTGTEITNDGSASSTLTASATSDTTFAGNITDGTGTIELVKSGTGALTLSGTNTYTGGTTISAGTLSLSGGAAIADSGAVTLANTAGAILDLASNEVIGSLAGGGTTGGNVTLNANTLTTGGNDATTAYAGVISGTGGLVKAGTGALTLSGTNTYTGGTTISAGTLALGGTGSTTMGSLSGSAGATFDIGARNITLATGETWDGADLLCLADGENVLTADTTNTISNCVFDNIVYALGTVDGGGNINVIFSAGEVPGERILVGGLPANGVLVRRYKVPVRGGAGASPVFQGVSAGRNVCILEGFIRSA